MRSIVLPGLILAGSVVLAGGDRPHDWPQWRGLNRDATSAETGLIDAWPEGGPSIVWRANVGSGYSAASVADGRLYTLGDSDGAQVLFGIDAATGKELWRRELGATFTNSYGDGPRSTPVVDAGLVFAVGTAGRLVAANAVTGEPVWEHDLVAAFGAELPTYGFSSSPLIVGDKLVLEVGGKDRTFMAFDRKTGKVAWSSQSDRPAYSSPVVASIHGREQVIFWSAHGLHAVDPRDGSLLWRHESETFCPVSGDPLNTGTPILIGNDRVFIASSAGATLLRIAKADGALVPEVVWQQPQMRSDVNAAVLVGDHIYGFNRGILQCIDARNGEVQWKARGFQRGSLIAADGKLIVLGEAGNLAIVDATPDAFVQLDTAQVLEGRNWTAPSLAGGRLYVRGNETLLCLDVKTKAAATERKK